jgi:hypothetical protein
MNNGSVISSSANITQATCAFQNNSNAKGGNGPLNGLTGNNDTVTSPTHQNGNQGILGPSSVATTASANTNQVGGSS